MRLWKDFKGQFSLGIFFLAILAIPAFGSAQTVLDVKQKISQKDADIAALEQEISSYQAELDALGAQKNTLKSALKNLDISKKQLNANIAITQNKIDKANLTIASLSSNIADKQSAIANDVEVIKAQIKAADQEEHRSMVENILSGDNFADLWNNLDQMISLRESLRQNIVDLKNIKTELEGERQASLDAKNQLLQFKAQLADQEKIIAQNVAQKNSLLSQTKNSESAYQNLLTDRIKKRDAAEKELYDYQAQLKYILDPSALPSGRVLSWPLNNVYVTQLFGVTQDSKRLYASGSHSGVDFKAAIGTPVLSMAEGTVLGVGDTDLVCPGASFGKFVFIRFTNGLSTAYGHLSLIKVAEGEHVSRGEVVAYSGATGHVTGPHLHVSLYASAAVKMDYLPSAGCSGKSFYIPLAPVNAYLNALDYLPPYQLNTTILNANPAE